MQATMVTEAQEFARDMASGLVVTHEDGTYDAEASAELQAWLIEHFA